MAEYLLSVWHDEDFDAPADVDFSSEQMQRLHAQVGAFNTDLQESGAWVFAGGLVYSLGVIFYVLKRVPFAHTIWHLFVLGGSVCHWVAINFYVIPR